MDVFPYKQTTLIDLKFFAVIDIMYASRKQLPIILQNESSECGLACLSMIASYHGHNVDLKTLRARNSISTRGATLASIMKIGADLALTSRPVKLEMDQISNLRLPCILHWNFNHFVVLHEIKKSFVKINDPAIGSRQVSWGEFSNSFTGVALELWPSSDFSKTPPTPSINLSDITGRLSGLKNAIIQVAIVAVALELIAALSPLFLKWLVDEVATSGDQKLLLSLALGFGSLVIFKQMLALIRSLLVLHFNTSFSIQWRTNILNHLIGLPIQYFEKRYLGDIVSRFESIEQIRNILTSAFFESILDGVMAIATLSMMFFYDVRLGAMVVAGIGSYMAVRWIWYRPQHSAVQNQIVSASNTNTHFIETLRGIKTIKLSNRQDERRMSWTSLLVEQVNSEVRVSKLQITFKIVSDLISGLNNVIVLGFGTKLILENNFSIGALVAFSAYKGQFDLRATAVVDKYWDYKILRAHCERLADIALAEPEHDSEEGLDELVRHQSLKITAKDLSFQYSLQDSPILDGIHFTISAGESVAITGPSGCGKTTLMNVILGILPPTNGDILINDKSITKFGKRAIRNVVGTVLQDDVLFAGTLAENISFFDPNPDTEWIQECAAMAAIEKEVDAMPMGYNTLVGDMGTILSGGQKQRIILARALYKRPRILLLDEATSSLDIAKERQVNDAIKKLNITRIIIAHRPETIASADRVIELHQGHIVNITNCSSMKIPSALVS